MKAKAWITVVLMALAVLVAVGGVQQAQAQDVPPYLVHQGRLMDALNVPITGAQDLTFNLYTEETGGTAFWTETQTVLLSNGFYTATLGQTQNLDLAQFSGATLYLGVVVAGEELTPRLAMQSVPYALKAGVAQNVTGDITPTSITIGGANGTVIDENGVSVGGVVVIDGSGEWSGPAPAVSFNDLLDRPFTFNDLNCANGEVPQVVGGAWTCTPASAADTLSALGCTESQIPQFVGGVWTCADDVTYAQGVGITISGPANTIAIDTGAVQARVGGSCAAGLSIRQINADGTVLCEDDTDTNTTYDAGAGITITGPSNTIAVDTTAIQGRITGGCAGGESIQQINADGSVLCEPDTDTTYSAAPGGGLILGGGNAFGIGADAITSARIADGAVSAVDLADNAVTSAKILDGAVSLADLATNSVDSAKILDGAVGSADLANTSVTNAKLADASVTTAKLADANVTNAKLADASVTAAKIADANVTTAKLADASVTAAKLADASVTSAKILDGTIVAADINTASVQARVGNTCAAGNSIRQINADGTVVCEPDDNSVYTDAQAVAAVLAADQYVRNTTDTMSGNLTVGGNLSVTGTVTGLTVTTANCAPVADACEIDGGELIFLDRSNNVACPANKVLVDWDVNNCGGAQFQLVFICCDLVVQ